MDFCDEWNIDGTAEFLLSHGYKRAALQFPDEYLASCKAVASTLQNTCHQLGHEVQVSPVCCRNIVTYALCLRSLLAVMELFQA